MQASLILFSVLSLVSFAFYLFLKINIFMRHDQISENSILCALVLSNSKNSLTLLRSTPIQPIADEFSQVTSFINR